MSTETPETQHIHYNWNETFPQVIEVIEICGVSGEKLFSK